MPSTDVIRAGATLLAAAMRDPADIVEMTTFWRFMKLVEKAAQSFTDSEKATPAYQGHVACYDRVCQLKHDMTPVNGNWMRLGPQLTEAFAAYAGQAADLLICFLDHCPAAHLAWFFLEFEEIMSLVAREVQEISCGEPVQRALATLSAAFNGTESFVTEN